jgi:hypothetical protein
MFPIGLGLKMLVLSALFVVLLFGLLIPIFQSYSVQKKLYPFFLILSLIVFINASLKANYSIDRKQPTSLNYVLNSNTQEAVWASYEAETNPFNEKYLQNATKGSFTKTTTASKYNTAYRLHKKTDKIAITEPSITTLLDSVSGENRFIHLQIKTNRNANRLELIAKDTIQFKTFSVNGYSLKKKKDKAFIFDTAKRKSISTYYFTKLNKVIDIQFTINAKNNPTIEIQEVKYDLFTNPLLNVKDRSDSKFMATPFVINDATIITKEIPFKND